MKLDQLMPSIQESQRAVPLSVILGADSIVEPTEVDDVDVGALETAQALLSIGIDANRLFADLGIGPDHGFSVIRANSETVVLMGIVGYRRKDTQPAFRQADVTIVLDWSQSRELKGLKIATVQNGQLVLVSYQPTYERNAQGYAFQDYATIGVPVGTHGYSMQMDEGTAGKSKFGGLKFVPANLSNPDIRVLPGFPTQRQLSQTFRSSREPMFLMHTSISPRDISGSGYATHSVFGITVPAKVFLPR